MNFYFLFYLNGKRIQHFSEVEELENSLIFSGDIKDSTGKKFSSNFEFIETKKIYNLFYTDTLNKKKYAIVSHPGESLF